MRGYRGGLCPGLYARHVLECYPLKQGRYLLELALAGMLFKPGSVANQHLYVCYKESLYAYYFLRGVWREDHCILVTCYRINQMRLIYSVKACS